MAPDRRFGLPHPLDADPSEDSSSRRKPGLWESFKRALSSEPSDARRSGDRPSVPVHEPPVPRSQPTPRPPVTPVVPAAPPPVELFSGVPFLEELPLEAPPVVRTALEIHSEGPQPTAAESNAVPDLPDPGAAPPPEDPGEPPVSAPRLARGLASFSRDNAVREKKFAHLLRDRPGGEEKGPVPAKRRRR